MLLFIVFLLRLSATDAMAFPKLCPLSPTGRAPCCPMWNGSPCGQSSGRGNCIALPAPRTVPDINVVLDERYKFPSFFYSSKCQCTGNCSGVHCGECIFNHYGEKCENLRIIIRYEIRQLTLREVTRYIAKLNYCKKKMDPDYGILRAGDRFRRETYRVVETSYYNVWCYTHYHATKPFLTNGVEEYRINYAHQSTGFAPWHRFYLLFLEYQMQKCLNDPTFALVYYDWRSDSNCSICTDQYVGSNNARGVISPFNIFSTWRTVCGSYDYDKTLCPMSDSDCERTKIRRQAGYVRGVSKPTKAGLDACLNCKALDTSPYDASAKSSFRNCLEGWVNSNNVPALSTHNQLHVYIGGTMSQVPIACNDPIFHLHHALIDKFFEHWLAKSYPKNTTYPNNLIYPNNPIYGHKPTDCITPIFHCWTMQQMTVPVWKFGVYYSNYNDPI